MQAVHRVALQLHQRTVSAAEAWAQLTEGMLRLTRLRVGAAAVLGSVTCAASLRKPAAARPAGPVICRGQSLLQRPQTLVRTKPGTGSRIGRQCGVVVAATTTHNLPTSGNAATTDAGSSCATTAGTTYNVAEPSKPSKTSVSSEPRGSHRPL